VNRLRYFPVVALLVLSSLACRRDMQSQPKYTALDRSWFYPDGRAARPIPRDTVSVDEATMNPALEAGSVDGKFVTDIPIPITAALLERGRDRYNIYCAPCHARTGFGNGMIASRGFKAPANLHDERVRNAPPGYIYQVIVNGYGAMAPYAYQIQSVRDRWAIVAYIRALELSRHATVNEVPPQDRSRLEAQR
jgi:mono/diheme cytochrome c family protein